MKKKGFTLIELLAVIVILAIIALIATPAVLNIIEDSRKGAAEASARNIVSTAKTYYMNETMNGRTPGSIDLSTETLKYDGDQATKGTITFENGKASGKMYVGGYCVEIDSSNKVVSEKMDEEECEIESIPVVYKTYEDGEPVYFNPTDGIKCSESQAVSTYGTKSGCMKWYAFSDVENSTTVKLLLDHNIGAYSFYNSTYLKTETANWKEVVNSNETLLNVSVINAEELLRFAEDQEMASFWSSTEYQSIYFDDSFSWLYDNLETCVYPSCTDEEREQSFYWTSTSGGFECSDPAICDTYITYGWAVSRGSLYAATKETESTSYKGGVRPVITVSKDVFK